MKCYQKLTRFMRNSGKALLAMTAMSAIALVTNSHAAAFGDPTLNDWDLLMKGGGQDGILFLHFTKDLDPNNNLPTFEGIYVYAGKRRPATPSARDGGGIGRTNFPAITLTNLFGGGFIHGTAGMVADDGGTNDWLPESTGFRGDWFYNSKGQIVGSYYTLIIDQSGTTNTITNNVSFTGNLVPSKHLTLSVSSSFGNFSAVGVPLVATSAPVDQFFWTGTRDLVNGYTVDETFSLSPLGVPNAFFLTGSGPSYTYLPGSFCLISSQKKIGFAIGEDFGEGFPSLTTGSYGSFSARKNAISAQTTGFVADQTNRISFNAAAVMVP